MTTTRAPFSPTHLPRALRAAALAAAVLAAGCNAPQTPSPRGPTPAEPQASAPVAVPTGPVRSSAATTPRAYRRDAASHLYGLNADRIHKGMLPSMLYAIGTLEVDIDRTGRITKMHWLRAPRHAPEVVAEIERTVRAAEPFPVATHLGRVTYTDTWLWDKGGRFQLVTLTEGQASR